MPADYAQCRGRGNETYVLFLYTSNKARAAIYPASKCSSPSSSINGVRICKRRDSGLCSGLKGRGRLVTLDGG